ncbi:hypothetical protein Cwoe_5817 [Conexibacter woesei DSM 14684]|uniref:SHOCT domain-containing protein n=1 Tax=Conexibacter woesei (strain DSM 14684 / CCUG 47730 / CIP 108061 / JCM 11494 / NBRC 100937 / ID131577) TaxID=469383 RepID=D3F2T7_CONWI|nr:hypothetical protein Cwoe_5817 [Conexibacter woesei DSM 14684]
MRYWTFSLLGVAICSAAVAVVAWCTYAATRISLCTPADDSLACRIDGGQLGIAIACGLLVAIPIGSGLFAHRTSPPSRPLGGIALSLALTASGGAALASALGTGASGDASEAIGFGVAAPLLSFGLILLLIALAAGVNGSATRARFEAAKAQAEAKAQAKPAAAGGAHARSAHADGAHARHGDGGPANDGTPLDLRLAGIGTLAAQLATVAAARAWTESDAVAASLRQLDALRASGLLTAEEHAERRRKILDSI